MSSSSLNANLAVMRSAFSTATTAAKVPDGRATSSVSTRECASNCIIAASTESTWCFCLLPSINCGLISYKLTTTPAVTGANAAPATSTWSQAGEANTMGIYDKNLWTSQLTSASAEAPERFRLVSNALRLSCVNASEWNNGWFEAVRVPTDYKTSEFMAVNDPADGMVVMTTIPRIVDNNNAWENGIIRSSRWVQHPSYVCGKLANLYKHQFYCQTMTNDRDFVKACENVGGCDTNFDTVLIRVHTTSTGANAVPLAIHWHVVSHIEMLYDAQSASCRYHSACYSAPKLVEKVDASIKKDPKASAIRSPNSFAYNP